MNPLKKRTMRRIGLILALCVLPLSLSAQSAQNGASGATAGSSLPADQRSVPDLSQEAVLAMATPGYPVTPGDIYSLSFTKGSQAITTSFVIEGEGQANLGIFGNLDTKGLRFRQVKEIVEKKVEEYYRGSNPSLLLVKTGSFPVEIKGEVSSTGAYAAWGLTRLSEIVDNRKTEHSNLRNVAVVSKDGTRAYYDIFKAARQESVSNNTYLLPGDSVEIGKATMVVTVSGEVYRPGAYQLLPGEDLRTVLEDFGGGFKAGALSERLLVTRKPLEGAPQGESLFVDFSSESAFALADGDKVRVPSKDEYLPVVYFEGGLEGAMGVSGTQAESAPKAGAASYAGDEYGILRVSYRQGMKLSEAARLVRDRISTKADLGAGYVQRGDEKIAVALEKLIYGYDAALDMELKPDDRVILPFKATRVYITGEVKESVWVEASGKERLSELLKDRLTPYSQTRTVKVRGVDGAERVYDVFSASRKGDLGQDPVIRAGETVEVARAERLVSLTGEVRRPGVYALLNGENLKELVNFYGDGATGLAMTGSVAIQGAASAEAAGGRTLLADMSKAENALLADGDKVRVPSKDEYLPVVYFEGGLEGAMGVSGTQAESAPKAGAASYAGDEYGILRVSYRQGMKLSEAARLVRDRISTKADLGAGYVQRGDEKIAVALEKLIYGYDAALDMELKPDDRVILPFKATRVYITGEVKESVWVEASGKERLSELLKDRLTPYSQTRTVKVRGVDGAERVYDVFSASRKGDLGQDPVIRAGETVEVARAERLVSLTGEVRRPGVYALLNGENLKELIYALGEGPKDSAKTDFAILLRKASHDLPMGESIALDLRALEKLPLLLDGDSLRIPPADEYLPVVYVEGGIASSALASSDPAQTSATASGSPASGESAYGLTRVLYRKGLTLYQAVKPLISGIAPKANLERAYVLRKGQASPILVNLEKILFAYEPGIDVALQPEDRIVLPFGSELAMISGDVASTTWVKTDGTLRLSQAIAPILLPTSSLRSVQVVNAQGVGRDYDLFRAQRMGEAEEDPILRSGDIVTVSRAGRMVEVTGEVYLPGKYELLETDGIREAVASYSGGLKPGARTDLALLTRRAVTEAPEGESLAVDLGASTLATLKDGDTLRIPARDEFLPVIYIEGAIASLVRTDAAASQERQTQDQGAWTAASGPEYGLARVLYRKGLSISQALKPLLDGISPNADLKKAYVLKKNSSVRIPVDLERLLFFYKPSMDFALDAEDRVVIPYGLQLARIAGEVSKTTWISVNGVLRLSEAVLPIANPTASLRTIKILSASEGESIYDLFAALRQGDTSQDPVLRPGDEVLVARASRQVTISGDVFAPGSYELLEGENLPALLGLMAGGLKESAYAARAVLTRKPSATKPEGESLVVDLSKTAEVGLLNGDSIHIPSREEYLPVYYLEGAVRGETLASIPADTSALATMQPKKTSEPATVNSDSVASAGGTSSGGESSAVYARIRSPYRKGLLLSTALRSHMDKIASTADLTKSFILRKGSPEPIRADLEALLYSPSESQDVALEADDRIIIPYGDMTVFVTGEVSKATPVPITGLTRLADVIAPLMTQYSSIRDVTVKKREGGERTYDLFRAERYGELDQNPYLLPGDEVRVSRAQFVVSLNGEVRRPGTYQLLAQDTLESLITQYADGLTEKANSARITMVRFISASTAVGEKLQVDFTATPAFALRHLDAIQVPPYQDLLPVAWFEGAIGVSGQGSAPQAAQRLPYTFFPGETVSQAVQSLRKSFSEVSDLANAYISRKGERLPVNLSRFLYDRDDKGDMALQANDIIIVPFRQFFVSVSGAVRYPGRYPYVPDRTWEYYVGLAGGLDTERNANQALTIYDVKSKAQPKDRIIQPEDNIVAAANSFTYNFYRISSILTTILSVASLIIALLP